MKNSIREPYVRPREMKPQFEDRREIRMMCSQLVFDRELHEMGMHLETHQETPKGYNGGRTIEQTQPDDGRRLRSQGIVYKA